jgi:hypothetical protein
MQCRIPRYVAAPFMLLCYFVQALSAAAGPLMRTYPERAIDLLNLLLPGIDVNDIWKCTDIFILMSDLLELMPVADLTKQHALTTASKTLNK